MHGFLWRTKVTYFVNVNDFFHFSKHDHTFNRLASGPMGKINVVLRQTYHSKKSILFNNITAHHCSTWLGENNTCTYLIYVLTPL